MSPDRPDATDDGSDATRRRILLGLGSAATVGLAGCTGDGGDGGDEATATPTATEMGEMTATETETATDTAAGTANVRVAHVSPDAPDVDVYVDGTAVLEDVPFGATSDYLEVPAGDRTVEITAAGDPDASVFEGTVTVEDGVDYTVAAAGEVADDADEPFAPLVLTDDNGDPGEDTARVRLVHASPDAPAVDVTAANGDVLYDGVAYGESGYVEVPAGDYTLQVRGDTEGNDGDVVAEFDVTLGSGGVYTAFAAGYLTPDDDPGDAAFDLLVAEDVAGEPVGTPTPTGAANVRVAHVSPDAPDVDVYVDGTAVLEDVPFGATSDYLEVPAGDRTVEITAAGDPDASVFEGTVTVEDGVDYTVAAAGEVADDADEPFAPLVLTDDNGDPGGDTARLRAVHVSPDAPAVDITAASTGDALFDGVPYGGSGYVEVPAGDYTVQIRGDTDGNDGDVVAEFDVSLAGGAVYTAFAAGYLTPDDDPGDAAFDLLVVQDVGGGGMGGSALEPPAAIDDFLADANGYDGTMVDATGQDSVTVSVGGDGLAFDPVALRIDSSTTIDWTWEGGTHNVASTSDSESDFDSGDPTGDTDTVFSQSFDNTGVQLYVCEVHESGGMLGAIEVV